jgi:hypothetical protein
MRSNQAYSVKVSKDNTWVPNGRPQDFHFQACADTHVDQSNKGMTHSDIRLSEIPENTDMLLLQTGFDNANLAAILFACIYVPDGKEWGPEYPDSNGRCFQEIEQASYSTYGTNASELAQYIQSTINAVFEHDKVKNNPDFQLFMPGYVQFFYDEGDSGDWCDNASFATRKADRPMLSLALRTTLNELVLAINHGIQAGINDSAYANRTQFVDVNPQFEGHRFCEPGHSWYDQWFGDKVWLWNLVPDGVISDPKGANSTKEVRKPTPEELTHWLESGTFTSDPHEISVDKQALTNTVLELAKGDTLGKNLKQLNINLAGLALRAFHPKPQGNSAISAGITKALHTYYSHRTSDVPWTASLQLLMREYNGYFSWFAYRGPYGVAVNPCYDTRFTIVVNNAKDTRKELSLTFPSYVKAGTVWEVDIPGEKDCRFEADADGPGSLNCGTSFHFPLEPDAGKDGKIINCHSKKEWAFPDGSYHRAWVTEYF